MCPASGLLVICCSVLNPSLALQHAAQGRSPGRLGQVLRPHPFSSRVTLKGRVDTALGLSGGHQLRVAAAAQETVVFPDQTHLPAGPYDAVCSSQAQPGWSSFEISPEVVLSGRQFCAGLPKALPLLIPSPGLTWTSSPAWDSPCWPPRPCPPLPLLRPRSLTVRV